MTDELKLIVAATLRRAEDINLVILAALAILIVAFLVRLSKGNEIDVYGVKINLRFLPHVIFGLTFAHFYVGWVFNAYVREQIYSGQVDTVELYEALRRDGPLFFAGLVARLEIIQGPVGPLFLMDPADPTTILSHFAAIAAFFVMIRWRDVSWRRRIVNTFISAILVVSNWIIGGGWAIHASCLAEPTVCVVVKFDHGKTIGGSIVY